MSKTVIILGAGASVDAGAPLMANFLEVAEDLLREGKVRQHAKDFERVFRVRSALEGAASRSNVNPYNLEEVFASFEMVQLFGGVDGVDSGEAEMLVPSLKALIEATLQATIAFRFKDGRPVAPAPYSLLRERLAGLSAAARGDLTFVTFNYDLCLDLTFHLLGWPVDYGLGTASSGGVRLLKLHGSLNFGECPDCGEVFAVQLDDYFMGHGYQVSPGPRIVMALPEAVVEKRHCGARPPGEICMVPPTWNKGGLHNRLRNVWRAAAQELRTAENILVTGYSLPDSDHFFRHLYALGTLRGQTIRRFWVHDPSGAVEDRFKRMLSPLIRDRFNFSGNGFGSAINDWSDLLGWGSGAKSGGARFA